MTGPGESDQSETRWPGMILHVPLLLLLMSFGSLPPTLLSLGKEKLILALFACVSVSLFFSFLFLAASQNA